MDMNRNPRAIDIQSLELTSSSDLEDLVDHDGGAVISKQHVLNTHLGWLRRQLLKSMFIQQGSLVEILVNSLRKHGFEDEDIYQSFEDWQQQETSADPSMVRGLSLVQRDLHDVLSDQNSHSNEGIHWTRLRRISDEKENKAPRSEIGKCQKKQPTSKGEQLEVPNYQVGKMRTGANDIPVAKRGHQGPTSARDNTITVTINSPSRFRGYSDSVEPESMVISGPLVCATSICDSNELTIMRETTCLEMPPAEGLAQSTPLSDDTSQPWVDYRGGYIAAVKSGVLDNVLPGEQYICKRCDKKGKETFSSCSSRHLW